MENFALILQTLNGFENQKTVHVTRHPIHSTETGPILLAGEPVGEEIIEDLVVALEGTHKERVQLMDDRVLAKTGTTIVWYRKGSNATCRFLHKDEVIEVSCNVPPLIFCASAGTLKVVAYKGKGKPNSSTKLFRAPFPNIGSSGSMCLGSNKLDHFISESMIDFVEEMFFESEFTELHGSCLKGVESYQQIVEFFEQLGEAKNDFPTRKLVAMNYYVDRNEPVTLESWLDSFNYMQGD